jgi:hypothetical protein
MTTKPKEREALLSTLKSRFENKIHRHKGIAAGLPRPASGLSEAVGHAALSAKCPRCA